MLACVLSACGSGSTGPATVSVVDVNKDPLSKPETTYEGRTALVRPGDNLYSISFAAGENYIEVARWNDITSDSYTIYPGQVIKLYPPESQSTGATAPAATPAATKSPTSANVQSVTTAGTTGTLSSSGWTWPASGQVIQPYSESANINGIHIAGELGQPVHAAHDGQVVYSGSGLPGYGRLIIVKHDTRFLSAYAHNSRLVVQEGSNVKRGQKIAEMGSSDSDRVKLHFEIRVDGKPVNPVGYLPQT